MPRLWTAPVPNAAYAGPLGNCANRPVHGVHIGAAGPDGQNTQGYINPCSDNPGNQPVPPPPGVTPAYYGRVNCAGIAPLVPANLVHGAAHSICRYCRDNVEQQPWYKLATARMKHPPPLNETPSWRGFWTRMCADCEIAEQFLLDIRSGPRLANGSVGLNPAMAALAAPNTLPSVLQQSRMIDYPLNTCTCLPRLQQRNLCIGHRAQQWINFRTRTTPPAPLANHLVERRNMNRTFLQELKRHPTNSTDCTASELSRITRVTDKQWRACRCGLEVVPHDAMRFLQCMCCEGVWQYAPIVLPAGFTANPTHAINHANNIGAVLTLGRNKSAVLV